MPTSSHSYPMKQNRLPTPRTARLLTSITGLALAVVLAYPLSAQETSNAETEISPNEVEQWVSKLDDDHYDVRQRAQLKLEQIGEPALNAVAEAAESGSLESVTRAVNILLQWSETDDNSLRREVLKRMANLPNRPREAAMATRLLATIRETEAKSILTELGATFERDGRVHGLSNLRVVLNKNWKGEAEDLKHIVDIPRATTISVQSAPVGDDIFPQIAQLPNVQRIELYKSDTTREAAIAFKKQFPQRDVDYRRGAMLGVIGMPMGQGIVSRVEEGSAAEKAGIQVGDNITELDGEPVDSFQTLTEKIGEFEAGQSATLTVVRGEETLKLKATFDDMAGSRIMSPQLGGRLQLTPNQIRNLQQRQRAIPQPMPIQVQPAK